METFFSVQDLIPGDNLEVEVRSTVSFTRVFVSCRCSQPVTVVAVSMQREVPAARFNFAFVLFLNKTRKKTKKKLNNDSWNPIFLQR